MTRLAIFDCDGTLVDGQAAVCSAMEAGFAAADLPPPKRADVRRIVGLSLPQAVAQLVPDASAERQLRAADAYRTAFRLAREESRLEEPLFGGIGELLRGLHANGSLLGVATGKSDRGLAHVLAVNDLTDLFVTLQTADRHPSKPDPAMLRAALDEAGVAPQDAVMIGDTTYDIHMAAAAGVRAIGVSWGYHASEELRAAGAVAVAGDCAELGVLIA